MNVYTIVLERIVVENRRYLSLPAKTMRKPRVPTPRRQRRNPRTWGSRIFMRVRAILLIRLPGGTGRHG